MALLDIIIPVYQVKQYLERCINSVLAQSFEDFEIILVDDGSTDGSGEICDSFAEQFNNIRVIHKTNGGLSSARNTGIQKSTAEFIMFLDSDDMIHPKTLEKQMNLIKQHNADVAVCSFQRFSDTDKIELFSDKSDENVKIISGIEAEKRLLEKLYTSKYVSSCGKIYKRKLFDDIQFPENRLFEDEFTTYQLYYKCDKIVDSDSVYYYYFINDNGITGTLNLNKRFDSHDAQMERIAFFKNKKETELYQMSILHLLHTAQWDLIACQKKQQEFDEEKAVKFQKQYASAMDWARIEKVVSFSKNYDYYVLAYPKYRQFFRLLRFIMIKIGKMQ